MGLPWGEGKESPWWDLSRAGMGSVFCPDCAERLKEVDGFLKF